MKFSFLPLVAFVPLAAAGAGLPPMPTLNEFRAAMAAAEPVPPPIGLPIEDVRRPALQGDSVAYSCLGLPDDREIMGRARAACSSGRALCVQYVGQQVSDFCARPMPRSAGVVVVTGVKAAPGRPTSYMLFAKSEPSARAVVRFIAGDRDEP